MSTSRLARHTLSALRLRTRPAAAASARTATRSMSSTAHAAPKSDKLWITGSALIFGPALLYLLSPSARKPAHHDAHHDTHHDASKISTLEPEPVVMKDAEGTPADVAPAVQQAEKSDVPQADAAVEVSETKPKADAGAEPAGEEAEHSNKPAEPEAESSKPAEPEAKSESAAKSEDGAKSESTQRDSKGEFTEAPVETGGARDDARKGTPPKKADEA